MLSATDHGTIVVLDGAPLEAVIRRVAWIYDAHVETVVSSRTLHLLVTR